MDTITVGFAGKAVQFGRGGKGIDEVNLAFHLEDSILINGVIDWFLFCDCGFLPVPYSCPVSFSGWGFII
jgi:hypothetical protein